MIHLMLMLSIILTGCSSTYQINFDKNNDKLHEQTKLSLKEGQNYEISPDYNVPTS
tara:strand:- start:347 stop:514 length:168 start_codon:yes stop_codon:yes gene_type:complete